MPFPDGPYRLVVADIDGTLLDSSSQLRPAVIDAVIEAQQAGILFTLATGRRYSTTGHLLQRLHLPHQADQQGRGRQVDEAITELEGAPPVVLQSGAVVVSPDGATMLHRRPVQQLDAQQAVEALIALGLQPIVFEHRVLGQKLITGPPEYDTPAAAQYLRNVPNQVERRSHDELVVDEDPFQIAVIGDRGPLEAAIPFLSLAHCRTIMSYSGNLDSYFMEIFDKHCNKGRGSAQVAAYLGFSIEQVVCIGDNWNDVEMLAVAGCGVAVANATPEVAAYARRVAPSNDEDAVAVILRQILQGEEPGMANPRYDPGLRN